MTHGYIRLPSGKFITFDASQHLLGSLSFSLTAAGATTGYAFSTGDEYYGFVRTAGGSVTLFEAGKRAGLFEGTVPLKINSAGTITGVYIDAARVSHGFVRNSGGDITTFDMPGAGTGSNQGTDPSDLNGSGQIAGYYIDVSTVAHGFVILRNGSL